MLNTLISYYMFSHSFIDLFGPSLLNIFSKTFINKMDNKLNYWVDSLVEGETMNEIRSIYLLEISKCLLR